MSVLASVADLRDYMNGVSLAAPQSATAQVVLDGLEQRLASYLRTTLVPEDRSDRLWIDGMGWATAKNRPINSVASVVLEPIDIYQFGIETLTLTPYGSLTAEWIVEGNSIYVGQPYAHEYVRVVYNAGPDLRERADMKAALLRVAARIMAPRHDDGRTLNGLQVDDDDRKANPTQAPMNWTPEELAEFETDRRRLLL